MADFWLPPEFLTDDDILMDFKSTQNKTKNAEIDSVFCFPSSNSGLSSPTESKVSSESEEEEYLAGLTRKMADSTLLDDLWKIDTQKNSGISFSPQSTLCGCKHSPPPASANEKAAEWDFLYAAAHEIKRTRKIEEANAYYRNQALSYQQLQIAKFQQMKREQLMKQQHAMVVEAQTLTWRYQKSQAGHVAQPRMANRQAENLSTFSWPTLQQSLQQQPATSVAGSGMRAVFLGNASSKRECAGTGVFLPRRASGMTEPRKKSGCATVLLPDRVVQALNLNLDAMDAQSRFNNALTSDLDVSVVPMCPQQKQNLRTPSGMAQADLRLPQEWTY